MTINELNEYILNYYKNDKTHSAIMLTAPWGMGKSYYIKNNLTVYLVDDEIKIINHTDSKIKYNNTSIPNYDVNADQKQIEHSISRIFISNSEYSINSNLRGYGRVNYITLTNNSLQSIGKEFYEHISGEYTLHSISDKIKDYFQGIQDVIINYKKENQNNGQKLQSILDIIFYSRIHKSNKKFLGKDCDIFLWTLFVWHYITLGLIAFRLRL